MAEARDVAMTAAPPPSGVVDRLSAQLLRLARHPAGFVFVVLLGSVLSVAVSFVVFPVMNVVHGGDHQKLDHMWQCPLTCICVWVVLGTLFERELLESTGDPALRSISRSATTLLEIWAVKSVALSGVFVAVNLSMFHPAPYVAVFATCGSVVCVASYILAVLVPRHAAREGASLTTSRKLGLWVLFFELTNVVVLMTVSSQAICRCMR